MYFGNIHISMEQEWSIISCIRTVLQVEINIFYQLNLS